MNTHRIAKLHRELAALHVELADAYDAPAPQKPRRRSSTVLPAAEVSPAAEQQARRALKKQGVAA